MDTDALSNVIEIFKKSGLAKLSVKQGDLEVSLEASVGQAVSIPNLGDMKELSEISYEGTICSSMVGTFYRSASPDVKPFVEVGDCIKSGDTLCIIEAMKVMNEIKAERDGVIKEIKVQDGDVVDFGKPLFVVE